VLIKYLKKFDLNNHDEPTLGSHFEDDFLNHQVEQLIKANVKDYIRTKTSQTKTFSSAVDIQLEQRK
jgi:hypothetical protein